MMMSVSWTLNNKYTFSVFLRLLYMCIQVCMFYKETSTCIIVSIFVEMF